MTPDDRTFDFPNDDATHRSRKRGQSRAAAAQKKREKRCCPRTGCGKFKHVAFFDRDGNGYRTRCRVCDEAYQARRAERRREAQRRRKAAGFDDADACIRWMACSMPWRVTPENEPPAHAPFQPH